MCGFALDRSSWDALPGVGHGFEMEGDQDLYQTLVERVCDGESWLPKSCNFDVGDLDKGLTDSALVTRSISYRFPPPSADLRKPASTPSWRLRSSVCRTAALPSAKMHHQVKPFSEPQSRL